MKIRNNRWITVIILIVLMTLLILDAKTAVAGAQDGINVSLHVVIPSLFPYIVLSCLINNHLLGQRIPFLQWLSKLCHIPVGTESLLLIGMIGGYPVGAQAIADACHSGQLDQKSARRMLGFCNNAGPAFIFGMVGSLFSRPIVTVLLWGIHVLSALVTGMLLPAEAQSIGAIEPPKRISLSSALQKSIMVLSGICGWIIIFRIFLSFLDRCCFCYLPVTVQVLLTGLCELANGCIALRQIEQEYMRFVLCAGMLAAGGLCVAMQTVTVTNGLGTEMYLPGKVIQFLISIVLALIFVPILYPGKSIHEITLLGVMLLGCLICVVIVSILFRKKGGILKTNVV